jgi:serine/threonine protein kinase
MQNNSPETSQAVDEHVEEFLRRRHAGEVTSADQYLREHPGLGPEFRDLLSALELLEQDKIALLGRPQVRAETTLSSAPLQVPNYEILGEIGRGGMGIVYRALHKTLNREVALKVLPTSGIENPQLLARFEQEARACAKLHHTNIVPIFEVGSADGVPFFAMQLIDGLGLDRVIERLSNGPSKSPRATHLRWNTGCARPSDRRICHLGHGGLLSSSRQDWIASVGSVDLRAPAWRDPSRHQTGELDIGSESERLVDGLWFGQVERK